MGKALSGELSCLCDRSCFFFLIIFVSPAKQKRDICIAFPVSSLSSEAAAA